MADLTAVDDGPRRRRKMFIWGGVLVALLVLVAVGVYVTEQPWFCGGGVCHEMGPSYDSWAESPHPNIPCVDCHVEPGIAGWFEGHVQDGLRDVWLHFTKRPDRVEIEPEPIPASQCLGECHGFQFDAAEEGTDDDLENALPSNHPERDSDCVECHYDEIHEAE